LELMKKLLNITILSLMMITTLACTSTTNKNGSFSNSPSYQGSNSSNKKIVRILERYDRY